MIAAKVQGRPWDEMRESADFKYDPNDSSDDQVELMKARIDANAKAADRRKIAELERQLQNLRDIER